jgi:hypothetical protein
MSSRAVRRLQEAKGIPVPPALRQKDDAEAEDDDEEEEEAPLVKKVNPFTAVRLRFEESIACFTDRFLLRLGPASKQR